MDKETKQMFELIITKLDNLDRKQDNTDKRLDNVDKRLDNVDKRLDNVDKSLVSMEKRQDEMYILQRGLEENIKVTRAEQEKAMYILADIQCKVTKLTEEVEKHENFISQIRAIK